MSSDWPYDPETGEILQAAPVAANVAEFSVTELSQALKKTLEDSFGYVRVRGELGRVSRPASGHVYLDLKDDKSVLSGVMWKGTAGRIKLKPEQGLEVVVTGRITTFPGQSRYQIIIETMEPAGAGALMALLEQRKAKLAAEGLFNEDRKQQIPYLPAVIGVVTSPSGAVIRDILHRLNDRFPRHVLVWPVRVQGEACAGEVAAAIAGFDALEGSLRLARPDLIIVARGGGSLEDLWGFNEEVVVRAAAQCSIPLISAIGHETDWTLLDYAADLRAPTPSAAAERAVPVRADLMAAIADLGARHSRGLRRTMDERRTRVISAARALPRPDDVLALARQRFDGAAGRLARALKTNTQAKRSRFDGQAVRLTPRPLTAIIEREQLKLTNLAGRSRRAVSFGVGVKRQSLTAAAKLLGAMSYQGVLERGFALVRDGDGKPVRQASAAPAGSHIQVQFADGSLGATVDPRDGEPAKAMRNKPARKSPGGSQGSLF